MSSSFSTNIGSREILNPRTMCGFRPLACQCRMTVLALTSSTASSTVPNTAPSTAPIFRVLQVALAPARDLHAAHGPVPGQCPCSADPARPAARCALATTLEHANTRTHSAREPCQLGLLRLAQLKNRGNSQSFAPMQTDVDRWRYLMYLSSLKNQTLH